ncbi:porin [Lacimicrobium alkaliphilum]|uniref:Outer membrane beta barrel protein n=1 Tax=Lacimicrobium alkaliphilum TaxID=1526571 RepID=A0ABQ1RIH0_9ALTE|nr:hypothetical protein [Lacimicrobium alkaliphilum]GGD69315.1 outer membrane beta barrel protein [Lacimicrobium alkaliphilum]
MVRHTPRLLLALCLATQPVCADEKQRKLQQELKSILEQMVTLQARVKELEARLAEHDNDTATESNSATKADSDEIESVRMPRAPDPRLAQLERDVKAAKNAPIRVGGAVRFQYVYQDYAQGNKDRGGDVDFDLIRLDFNGEIGDVILAAQYRWFQYMEAVQKAYVGYNLSKFWQAQVGIINVPFGNLPYNSHNYFFSSNFYAGLEDNPETGANLRYRSEKWEWDLGFYKNGEQGGVDGFVSNRDDRYAYDPVGIRIAGEGIFDAPSEPMAQNNSWALRGARKFTLSVDSNLELGLSVQHGDLHNGSNSVGERSVLGGHLRYNKGPWELMAMASRYDYDLAQENEGVVMGAYAYFDTMPARATLYTLNLAYDLPVSWGPVTNLRFYDNYSLMSAKSGLSDDTFMNVLGMAVSAGGLYTYFDLVTAQNHPFVGGSMGVDGGDTNTRFNINFGYYF